MSAETGSVLTPLPEAWTASSLTANPSGDNDFSLCFGSPLSDDNAENRLIRMESIASVPPEAKQKLEFAYDFQGRRIEKKVWVWRAALSSYLLQSATRFVYDGWNLVAELNGSGLPIRTYVWGQDLSGALEGAGGIGGLLLIREGTNTTHVGYDGNGNVTALVKASTGTISASYDYDPFGNVLRATGEASSRNPFTFSTKYMDQELGLLYYGLRYYNPSTGRWLSRDPIAEAGGIQMYGFVGNNPITWIDLLGLFKPLYHRSMTEQGLKDGGVAPKYIPKIVDADVAQDDGALLNTDPFADPLNHGDNNKIRETIARMKQRLDEIAEKQKHCNHCVDPHERCADAQAILRLLGQVLHALQDLYAHSNYVENYDAAHGRESKPGDIPIWQMLNADGSPNIPPATITGNSAWPNGGKSPSHRELNKDEPNSDRGKMTNKAGVSYVDLAYDVAERHTRTMATKVESDVLERLETCCPK